MEDKFQNAATTIDVKFKEPSHNLIINTNSNEKNLKKYFKDFCKSTKIYGFNYLVEPNRFRVEKYFWILFILVSFGIIIILLLGLWTNRNREPIVILKQNQKSIWEVPFPAITICPETKIRQSIYNFTDNYHRIYHQLRSYNITSPRDAQTFSEMSLLCDNHLYTEGSIKIKSAAIQRLKNVAPTLKQTFFGCKWTSLNESFESLFTPILTEDGFCFTFNMLSKEEIFKNKNYFQEDEWDIEESSNGWSLEEGYSNNDDYEYDFPRRTRTSGTKGGLFILLKADEQDFDYVCRGPVQGFKILLHQPGQMPKISTHYIRVPLNQEITVSVKPNLITTNPVLKKYDSEQRECIFDNEVSLKYFRNYTLENCRSECLTNFTVEKCGCAAFYMPREKYTPICGSGSNRCMFQAEQELMQIDDESDICSCLPACTSLTYNSKISQADFNWRKVLQAFKSDVDEFPRTHMTRIVVFFDDMYFDSFIRTKNQRSYIEFLADCGGILFLLIGFSFFSLAEIVYFLSLRIICNVKKYGIRRWAGLQKTEIHSS